MHQCTHCQADLADNAQFCTRCGMPTEESQTRSANLDEVDELETTSKHPIVAVPTTPSLPTLRTRRMHPNSSIPEFPQGPWLPTGSAGEDESTTSRDTLQDEQSASASIQQIPLTPPLEIGDDFPQTQATSEKPEAAASTLITQQEKSFPSIADTPALSTFSMVTPDEISTYPTGELAQSSAHPLPDEIATSPTGKLAQAPANSRTIPDEIATSTTGELARIAALPRTPSKQIFTSPTGEPAQSPAFSAAQSDEISTIPTNELQYASPFPPPTPERRSTPRPMSTLAQSRKTKLSLTNRTRTLILALIVVLVVLAGGGGAFALIHQSTSTGSTTQCNAQATNCTGGSSAQVHGKPTLLTFSGAVAGPMSIVAKPRCQISTAGNLRALTVNLSGTINGQLYNFGFVIDHYNGPSTYNNSAATTTILFDVPGQSTTNGWGNSAPTDNGSITVERGEQTGSISYTLSGVGTQAKTQIQTTGNWTCGN